MTNYQKPEIIVKDIDIEDILSASIGFEDGNKDITEDIYESI